MFDNRAGQVAKSQLYDGEGDEVKDYNRCAECNVVDHGF
jgi:hypothetical protein